MRKIISISILMGAISLNLLATHVNAQEEVSCSSASINPPTGTPETEFSILLNCTGDPNTVLIFNQDTGEEIWRMTLLPGWADNPIPVTRSLPPGNYTVEVWGLNGSILITNDFQVDEGEIELPNCGDIISLEDENLCPPECPAFTRYDEEEGSITRCQECGGDLQACCPSGNPCNPGLTCRILPPAESGTCLLLDYSGENDPRFCIGTENLNTAIGCIPFTLPENIAIFFLSWGVGVGGGIAFLLSTYAGFQVITSSGDPKRLEAGKSLLWSALTGLALIIFSVFLLRFIGVNILGIWN